MDPMTEEKYRPLLLDPYWWRVAFQRKNARFCNNPSVVSGNISDRSNAGIDRRDVALHVLQELIYQSNPTLEPVIKWPHSPSMRFVPKPPPSKKDFVGQYQSFKGYIDRGSGKRDEGGVREEDTRISEWPITPRERRDNLHATWQNETILAPLRIPLPDVRSRTAPAGPPRGGMLASFGLKSTRFRDIQLDRSPPASAPGSARGPW